VSAILLVQTGPEIILISFGITNRYFFSNIHLEMDKQLIYKNLRNQKIKEMRESGMIQQAMTGCLKIYFGLRSQR
jgi:hypothetical protein